MQHDYSKTMMSVPPLLPARLDVTQTAGFLGFSEHDIPVLVQRGHLTPLGKPMPNARKYFSRNRIIELSGDDSWLNKATRTIYEHWQDKNASRKEGAADDLEK